MAPPVHPASLASKRVPVTLRAPSITAIAPPIDCGLCPGRLVRLAVNSPPSIVAVASRTTIAPPRRFELLPSNEQPVNVAVDPTIALTAPPPVSRLAARLPVKRQLSKRAAAADRVTPPAKPVSAL